MEIEGKDVELVSGPAELEEKIYEHIHSKGSLEAACSIATRFIHMYIGWRTGQLTEAAYKEFADDLLKKIRLKVYIIEVGGPEGRPN